MNSRMVKTDMGDKSYVYDFELWTQGMEEKLKIELVCTSEAEAEVKARAIETAVASAQGCAVVRLDTDKRTY